MLRKPRQVGDSKRVKDLSGPVQRCETMATNQQIGATWSSGNRVMYGNFGVMRGDGYIRTPGGTDGDTVDVLVTGDGEIAVELGDWQAILA